MKCTLILVDPVGVGQAGADTDTVDRMGPVNHRQGLFNWSFAPLREQAGWRSPGFACLLS